ncbi:hypothetical protein ccbrp13_20980 [Ktedonobacteria bacterium brp13]|nr:hypothetical protein ccbrp13_20980 [Ktedonobacteria bacterium brp13]
MLADLIIGVDGVHPKVRTFIAPIIPGYSGVTLIEMEIENPEIQCHYFAFYCDMFRF